MPAFLGGRAPGTGGSPAIAPQVTTVALQVRVAENRGTSHILNCPPIGPYTRTTVAPQVRVAALIPILGYLAHKKQSPPRTLQ